jgi:hypothetical protein
MWCLSTSGVWILTSSPHADQPFRRLGLAAYPDSVEPRKLVIGVGTSLLALLALTAMHVLPAMGPDTQQPMVGMVHGVSAQDAPMHAATGFVPTESEVGAAHDAGGVPWHGHSLMHLCFAVLVVALMLALSRWLRPRVLAVAPQARSAAHRLIFSLDIGPPNRVALCVVRC